MPQYPNAVTAVDIRDLTLQRAGVTVLKNVSLSVPHGQISALVGRSGSGKSTLLRCLNRLLEPPPNTIFLDNQDITTLDVLQLRRRVGLLLQTPLMFAGSVSDNVGYPARLRGETLSDAETDHLLRQVGLEEEVWAQSAENLSGGQAQRVALARTLANRPTVLLLDEPTSALDPDATEIIEQTVRRLCTETGLTVVWVSHLHAQVDRIADQIITLEHGEILA
jgi:putative ABC transport system ATP-binding protein